MPSKSATGVLHDMTRQIRLAQSFVEGSSFEGFQADRRTVYAVIRCLEIISEASRRLPDELKARHPEVPWAGMAGGRHETSRRRRWAHRGRGGLPKPCYASIVGVERVAPELGDEGRLQRKNTGGRACSTGARPTGSTPSTIGIRYPFRTCPSGCSSTSPRAAICAVTCARSGAWKTKSRSTMSRGS